MRSTHTPRVQKYLDAVRELTASRGFGPVSVILFGSAATGGFSDRVSDVDLILVLPDSAGREDRLRLRREMEELEVTHGFRDLSAAPHPRLETFVRKVTGNAGSFFICTRSDLLSGDPARLLDIPRAQALFVDRGAIAGILCSAVTAWGEDLLPQVAVPSIRRVDVFKALWSFWNQVLLSAVVFPVLPSATNIAMGALKRSVHNCYFCYHVRLAPLSEEVDFFQRRLGPSRALTQLMELRRDYAPSFPFTLRCLPTLVRLHLWTAADNQFPRFPRK